MSKDSISSCGSQNNYQLYENAPKTPTAPGSKFSYSKDSIEFQHLRKEAATRFEETSKSVIFNNNIAIRIGKSIFLALALPPYFLLFKIPQWVLVTIVPMWFNLVSYYSLECAKKIVQFFQQFAQKMGTAIRKKIEPIIQLMNGIFNAIHRFNRFCREQLNQWMSLTKERLSSIKNILNPRKLVAKFFEGMAHIAERMIKQIRKRTIDPIVNRFIKVSETIQKKIASIRNYIGQLNLRFTNSQKLAETISANLKSKIDSVHQKLANRMASIKQKFSELFRPSLKAIKELFFAPFRRLGDFLKESKKQLMRPLQWLSAKFKGIDSGKIFSKIFPSFTYSWLPEWIKNWIIQIWHHPNFIAIRKHLSRALALPFQLLGTCYNYSLKGFQIAVSKVKTVIAYLNPFEWALWSLKKLGSWFSHFLFMAIYYTLLLLFITEIVLHEMLKLIHHSGHLLLLKIWRY